MITRIRDEGFHHSQVMDTLFHLTDVVGPRLTGSPQLEGGQRVDPRPARGAGASPTRTWRGTRSAAAGASAPARCAWSRRARLSSSPSQGLDAGHQRRGARRGDAGQGRDPRRTSTSTAARSPARSCCSTTPGSSSRRRRTRRRSERYSAADLEKLAQFEIPGEPRAGASGLRPALEAPQGAATSSWSRRRPWPPSSRAAHQRHVVSVTGGGYWSRREHRRRRRW